MVSLIYHIRPSRTEAFETSSRCLLIEAGMDKLSILLWDKTREIPEAAEIFSGVTNIAEDWELMSQQSELLGYSSLETIIFLNYPRVLPVPSIFYRPAEAKLQLDAFFGDQDFLHTGGDILPELDMVIGWQVPKDVFECFCEHFDSVQFKSVASLVLHTGVDLQNDSMFGRILVSGQLVWLAAWRNRQLLIIKSIPSAEPENIAYQMINICRQWGIETEKMHWKVSGLVNQDSPLWETAAKFFVHFDPEDTGSVFAPDIPVHYFAHQIKFLQNSTGK